MTSSKGPVGLGNGKRVLRRNQPPDEILRRLRAQRLPSLPLVDINGNPVGLERYSRGWAAIYFYGGTASDEQPSALEDIAFHAGYCHHHYDLLALGVRTVGVSTEPAQVQGVRKTTASIPHDLLSDPDLRVAEEMGMPTAEDNGKTVYQQATLVAKDGIIEWVFYPIEDRPRSASQVVAWIRQQHLR